MIVVSDASPLRYTVLLGLEFCIFRLYGEILVPPAVLAELRHSGAPQLVRDWSNSPPEWVRVVSPTSIDPSLDVDPGEAEAISLAMEKSANAVLIDDRKGRRVAQSLGLTVIGTLTLLRLSADLGWHDLKDTLERLQSTNFRVSDRLLKETLGRPPSESDQ